MATEICQVIIAKKIMDLDRYVKKFGLKFRKRDTNCCSLQIYNLDNDY